MRIECFCGTYPHRLYLHSRTQRPRSFWSAPRITTSGPVQRHSVFEWLCKHNRLKPEPIRFVRLDSEHAQSDGKSANRGLPVLDQSRPQSLRYPCPAERENEDLSERPFELGISHSRPQRPRSFWSAPRIATSGHVQHRKSAIHGLPVTLRMFRVKSDKSDWFWSQSIVFSKPFKNGMSLDRARGRDSWC